MIIDDKLISHLEELSKLHLSEEERQSMKKDLNEILLMIDKLNEVDVSGIEPLIHMNTSSNILRQDEVGAHLELSKALNNAPSVEGPFITVPKVVKQN